MGDEALNFAQMVNVNNYEAANSSHHTSGDAVGFSSFVSVAACALLSLVKVSRGTVLQKNVILKKIVDDVNDALYPRDRRRSQQLCRPLYKSQSNRGFHLRFIADRRTFFLRFKLYCSIPQSRVCQCLGALVTIRIPAILVNSPLLDESCFCQWLAKNFSYKVVGIQVNIVKCWTNICLKINERKFKIKSFNTLMRKICQFVLDDHSIFEAYLVMLM